MDLPQLEFQTLEVHEGSGQVLERGAALKAQGGCGEKCGGGKTADPAAWHCFQFTHDSRPPDDPFLFNLFMGIIICSNLIIGKNMDASQADFGPSGRRLYD
jgi:hypothetical protein